MIYQGLWHCGSNKGSCGEIVARQENDRHNLPMKSKMPQIWHWPQTNSKGTSLQAQHTSLFDVKYVLIQLLGPFLDFALLCSSKVFGAPLHSSMLFYTLLYGGGDYPSEDVIATL